MSYHAARAMVRWVCVALRPLAAAVVAVAVFPSIPAHAEELPSGWTASNIGGAAPVGRATYQSGSFRVEGGGTRVFDRSDEFFFVHRRIAGDATIIARISSIEKTDSWARAGVMIRETLAANSKHAFALVTPEEGIAFHRRSSTGSPTQGLLSPSAAPVWLRLIRSGSTITAARSSDGVAWTTLRSATISMASTVYVGLAVSSYTAAALATGTFTNVNLTESNPGRVGTRPGGPPVVTPPTVTLTSPPPGATFTAPATVNLAASASSADDVIADVEFYANGGLVGTDATRPYAYAWIGVPAGRYTLTAVARDRRGATATSSPRTIIVSAPESNVPPSVSLTAPAAGSAYVAPASITIAARATDSDGTIARVDFYAGATLVGSDVTSPYAVTWRNVPAGSYILTAVAQDNRGARTTSVARTITVSNAAIPTRAIFGASPDHASVTRYVLDVFTAGANPANTDPIATQNLGKPAVVKGECTADIAAMISGLPSGNYFATVVAVSRGGTSTRVASSVFAR